MDTPSADDELLVLAQLEEDLSAVEVAIGRLDAVSAESGSAFDVADQVEAAVPEPRFRLDDTPAAVRGDGAAP